MLFCADERVGEEHGFARVSEVLIGRNLDSTTATRNRNAENELAELADLVTEMEQVKHPFRSGVKAQAGIEF